MKSSDDFEALSYVYQESRSRTRIHNGYRDEAEKKSVSQRVWIVQIRLFPKAEGRGIGGRARRMGLGVSFVGERERRTQLKGQRGGAEREGKRESSHS